MRAFELHMASLRGLFDAPQPDPFAFGYQPRSGMLQIFDALNAQHVRATTRLQINIVLSDQQDPDAAQRQLRLGVDQFCDVQTEQLKQQIKSVRLEGWQSLRIGIIFLGACIALSTLFAQIEGLNGLVRRVLVEGISIAGWVALWRPFELLLYDWWPHRRRLRFLRLLRDATWTIDTKEAV